MDETIIFPSPNWFQGSVFAASSDNWLIYGGPSKSLCVLEPSPPESKGVVQGNQGYKAHVLSRAHPEKIVCVDISPEWPAKRSVLTGSVDGSVKQWSFVKVQNSLKMKATQNHDIHIREKEEVVGVGYCNNGYAVTVGCYGQIVKWDLNSNVMKNFNQILKNFRPVCMACSPHIHLNVAIGTKQGVVFLLDLNGTARVIYKVRGQDDEVIKVSWCPQYEITMRKNLKELEKRSMASDRMEQIRQTPESVEALEELDERVKKSTSVEHFMKGKTELEQTVKDDDTSDHPDKENVSIVQFIKENGSLEQPATVTNVTEPVTKPNEKLDESGIGKTLPEDSFDEAIASVDDMFDIYADHEADEFGHKKFQPIDIVVKVTEEKKDEDFLSECLKLKEDIMKRKNEPKSIEALVEALDNTHVDSGSEEPEAGTSQTKIKCDRATRNAAAESSVHIQKHLLATISKHGSVRIWSKTGKLVGSCSVPSGGGKQNQKVQRNPRNSTNWTTLLWYKPDVMLIADGKSQLLECYALKMDCKAKLEWKPIIQHRRNIYTIATNAPRVQTPDMLADSSHDDQWYVWTTSQDRNLVKYSVKSRRAVSTHNTSGGYLYTVESCPYDARKVAVSVGDGGVRVCEADVVEEGEGEAKLAPGHVSTHWNNVQGKVLTVAWHPTRENLLAFGTAESRVGLIDASGVGEKAAKVLLPALSGGVYSLCWGEDNDLYACASGEIVVYQANKQDDAPTPVRVEVEGHKWDVSIARWYAHAFVCGSNAGAVAVLTPSRPHDVITGSFVFNKMIHTIDWHPQQTSNCSEESPYKNLIAVCSVDKVNTVVILEYSDKGDGTKQLLTWKTLTGHKNTVLQVAWSPHVDSQLLSTSQDGTVRIWNATEGVCISVFDGHMGTTLGATWSAFPQLATKVLSGGGDCCLRLWDITDHPAVKYEEDARVTPREKREKKKKEKKGHHKNADEDSQLNQEENEAMDTAITVIQSKIKSCKRFLLPLVYKQINPCTVNGVRKLLKKHLQGSGDLIGMNNIRDPTEEQDLDYIKMFGNMKELNELLDDEMERHQDTGNFESFIMLCIFRGHIDAMIQFASQRDLLDSFLLSITPSVSLKYWKDVMQMYLAQIDRVVARGEEVKLFDNKNYGGSVYRKVAALLSIHDVKGAVAALTHARLYKEAYVLCRTRYIESIAEETLEKWAHGSGVSGNWNLSAACYIALGRLSDAATILAKSTEEDALCFAAELAKVDGQAMFVDHIEKKREQLKTTKDASKNEPEDLKELPSRVELLMHGQKELPISVDPVEELPTSVDQLTETQVLLEAATVPAKQDITKPMKDTTFVPSLDKHANKEEKNGKTEELEELSSQMERLLNDDTQIQSVVADETGESVETRTDAEQKDVETENRGPAQ